MALETFDIANFPITSFSTFENTFQIIKKNLVLFLFFLCFVFTYLFIKVVIMTNHRALTTCKNIKA